ncbi:MAG: hypothetical protein HY075_01155 [Deltaproteobacteria bacterium]|nr:hypothetical protein [Deltaproteobacteria bacterium]
MPIPTPKKPTENDAPKPYKDESQVQRELLIEGQIDRVYSPEELHESNESEYEELEKALKNQQKKAG